MPEEQHDDPFEDRLGAALREAGGAFDTDRAALSAAGENRGRRLRRQRRAVVGGAVAGIALVGVGGALLSPWGDASGPHRASVASETTASTTKPTAKPTAKPVSGEELIRTLKGLLPKGKVSKAEGRGTDEFLSPYAHVVYDDGKGGGAVGVSLGRVEPGSDQARQATQCPDKVFTPHDSCTTSRLSDGSVLMLLKGYEYPDRRVDTKWWNAELITPAGQHISVSEWNAEAEKDAPITRPEPPLSAVQLKSLITAGAWRTAVDAIPEDPKKTGTAGTPGTAEETAGAPIGPVLAALLPKGLKVVGKGAPDSQFAYVVVNDGKGRSLVQINVQPDMSDVEGDLFGTGAETLPDGTKVATHQGPGEKGGSGVVMWTVDTIRTDGMRVVISAFNSGTQNTAATRKAPALTMKQLREIALSPKWRQNQG
ncbi:hypothetical protein AB5J56_16890 [Streptomyces sp. R21]|uniref:LigA protein n=1 Tax=Streptomyces sp. R21 TaxID=3238627 RepID=A0AB39P6D3_9ACTN